MIRLFITFLLFSAITAAILYIILNNLQLRYKKALFVSFLSQTVIIIGSTVAVYVHGFNGIVHTPIIFSISGYAVAKLLKQYFDKSENR